MTAPSAPGGVKPATKASDSMIETAWGFRPNSGRYAIGLYRPNYLQLASYSSHPNDAAFKKLFTALGTPDADLNSNIEDYMGWGDITGVYKWHGNSFTLMGRGNPDTWKGAAQLTWTSAPLLGPLRLYANAFTGYGYTLIDYDWKQNVFGIGVSLNDLLDGPVAQR